MIKLCRVSIFLLLLTSVVVAGYAGGSGEATAPTAEKPSGADVSEALQALGSIGIQVFSDEIEAMDFTLDVLGGGEASLSSYEGKVVFLNFWATWCGPCVQEMPSMQALYEELSEEEFEIVAVNLQEPPGTVQAFVDRFGYTYPILLDRRGEVGQTYSVRGIPSTFIVAPDGRLLGMKIGYRLWDEPGVVEAFRTVLKAL